MNIKFINPFKDPESRIEVLSQEKQGMVFVSIVYLTVGLLILYILIHKLGIQDALKFKVLEIICLLIILGAFATAWSSYKISIQMRNVNLEGPFFDKLDQLKKIFYLKLSIFFGIPYLLMCVYFLFENEYASFFDLLSFLMLAVFFSLLDWYQLKKIKLKIG